MVKHNPVSAKEWAINWLQRSNKVIPVRSPKRSMLLRFLPDRLWRRSQGWGRWVRWPPTPSMSSSRGRPRIGGLIASSSDLEVTLSLESVQNHYISPFPMFPKNLAFFTGLTAEIATSVSLVTLVWAGTMCELLNKPSRRGGNQGSTGQTGGELQGNTEMFLNP